MMDMAQPISCFPLPSGHLVCFQIQTRRGPAVGTIAPYNEGIYTRWEMKGERTLFGEKMRKKNLSGRKTRRERCGLALLRRGGCSGVKREDSSSSDRRRGGGRRTKKKKKKVGFCPPFHLFSTLKDLRLDSTQLFVPFFIFIDCRWLLCVSDM